MTSSIPHPPTKVCTGPAHPGPTRLPLDARHWYFHGASKWAIGAGMVGKPISRCRLCGSWSRLVERDVPHGLVPVPKIEPFVRELVERCGSTAQVVRVHGFNRTTIDRVLRHEIESVKAKTAARVLVALGEQRKIDRRNGTSERFVKARREQAQREERLDRLAGY